MKNIKNISQKKQNNTMKTIKNMLKNVINNTMKTIKNILKNGINNIMKQIKNTYTNAKLKRLLVMCADTKLVEVIYQNTNEHKNVKTNKF